MADVREIRKVAARVLGEGAFADLTKDLVEDDSLDQVLIYKAAQADNRPLFEIAMKLPGNPINNYEALGGTFKKEAFGQPMFSAAPAPDPKVQAAGMSSSPSGSSSSPKPPSGTSGPQGGGGSSGSTGAPKVQSVPEPSVPGAGASAGTGGGMG